MTWDQDDTYSIFSKPEDGILSNPRLEYIAENCKNCKLEITPTVDEFIDDNPNVFGVLKGVLDKGYSNRYTFLRLWEIFDNAISLNISNLTPDKYTITLTCTGPENEYQTETLRLNIYPQMRWREVVPVINH